MALSKAQQKYFRSLKLKKFRELHNVFIVEGAKICEEVLNLTCFSVKHILGLPNWIKANDGLLKFHQSKIIEIAETDLKQISNLASPNQVLIICEKPIAQIEEAIVLKHISLFLDNIQDPGNMGTLMRIADWFGIPYIFCAKGCVEWTNPKVIQSTMGAFLRVKMVEMEFAEFQSQFPNVQTFATVLGGENIYEKKLPQQGLIIIGNESKGISEAISANANHKIRIPKGQNGGAESLNAGVAAGIICSQFCKP